MHIALKSFATATVVAVVGLAAARPAHAAIIVATGNNNQGIDNVLLTDAADVDLVTGTLNAGLFDVYFLSSGGKLSATASGQAVITPGAGNDPFTALSFYIDAATFTRAVFNVNSADDGLLRLSITDMNGALFIADMPIDDHGQNFFTIDATNGQRITNIGLLALGTVELEDLRQVRIGGVEREVAVPEPASMILFGAGWAALAAARRRRRA